MYDLDDFNARIKPALIRLPGCEIWLPGPDQCYRRLDGGRAVYIAKSGDTTGYAIVSRAVCRVQKVSPIRWNVVPELEAGNGAA